MDPRLRAIADRYILDVANLQFMTASLPDEALGRRVVDSEWTVAEVVAHLVAATAAQADWIENVRAGEPLGAGYRAPGPGEPAPDMDAIMARLPQARDRVIGALGAVPVIDDDGVATLDRWSRHYARHGIDLAEALHELRMEPMVLNWLLYADFRDEPAAFRRQQALLAEVRERYPSPRQAQEGEDDDS